MKSYWSLIMFGCILASTFLVSAQPDNCVLTVSLLNQDPIHAVPGEYVKLVFQMRGLENPNCNDAFFRIVPNYPFTLDPGVDASKIFSAGTYTHSYSSAVTLPYKVRIDEGALDENYSLVAQYGQVNNPLFFSTDFNITVKDIKTDFDLFVQDYDPTTHMATIDVLNTGKNNVEALTAQVAPNQAVVIKGSTKSVLGSLDASQDSTFTLEIPPQKEDIVILLAYTDIDGTRRTAERTVTFDPSYFTDRQATKSSGLSGTMLFIIAVVVIAGIYFFWRRVSRRRKESRR